MKWFRSYQKQGAECARVGNRFTIKSTWHPRGIVVCVPFKTECHSKACVERRKKVTKGGVDRENSFL